VRRNVRVVPTTPVAAPPGLGPRRAGRSRRTSACSHDVHIAQWATDLSWRCSSGQGCISAVEPDVLLLKLSKLRQVGSVSPINAPTLAAL